MSRKGLSMANVRSLRRLIAVGTTVAALSFATAQAADTPVTIPVPGLFPEAVAELSVVR